MYELRCVGVALCGSSAVWEMQCVGVAVCGTYSVWQLLCMGVAMCGSCVWELQSGELRCVGRYDVIGLRGRGILGELRRG